VLLLLAGHRRIALRTGIAAGFVLILPIEGYHRVLERMTAPDHPLDVAGECAANIHESGVPVGKGFYNAAALVADHPYYYYLRHTGPWLLADRPVDDQLQQRLFVAGEQTPIVLSRKDYELLTVRVAALWTDLHAREGQAPRAAAGVAGTAGPVLVSTSAGEFADESADESSDESGSRPPLTGIAREDSVVVLLPGPYAACVAPAVAAGGEEVGDHPQRRSPWR
jgi:hypothetical protein